MRNVAISSTIRRPIVRRAISFIKPLTVATLILVLFMAFDGSISRVQAASAQKSDVEQPLRNIDVITMAKAGLGDDIVVAKIQQAPREELDVSVQALLDLKKRGLSKTVIEAMVKRVDKRTKQSAALQPESGTPASGKSAVAGASGEPACVANFVTEGGFVRGETKRSFQDYPDIKNWESLFDGATRAVTRGGWQISNSNKEAGTITGVANVRNIVEDVRQLFGVDVTRLTLNVLLKKKESGGVRIETALVVPAGTMLPDDDAKTVFCRILSSIAQ